MTPSAPEFELSEHARTVLVARDIDVAWVARILSQPLRTEDDPRDPSLRHALGPIVERDGRVLRIVYNHAVQPVRLVTAFFDRRERRPQ